MNLADDRGVGGNPDLVAELGTKIAESVDRHGIIPVVDERGEIVIEHTRNVDPGSAEISGCT